jgi:pimeloyl-ACP methyl ester carboxylesterase
MPSPDPLPIQPDATSEAPSNLSFVSSSSARIGYEVSGEGPPLLLVHGAFSDHRTNWAYVKPFLARHFTVYAMARRGRGSSDATAGHGLEDEMEDAASLLRRIGKPAFVIGHSYGAHVALGAARAAPALVRRLVLYEAPWPHLVDGAVMAPLEGLAASGDWQGFATLFFREVLAVPEVELAELRQTTDWLSIVADAPASLADLRALARYAFTPERFQTLPMPVLLQTGSESPPDFYVTDALAAVLPDVALDRLEGQAHEGMTTAPEQYAQADCRFLTEAVRRAF